MASISQLCLSMGNTGFTFGCSWEGACHPRHLYYVSNLN